MIQRKQTLFLLVAFLLTLALCFISLGQFVGPKGIFEMNFYSLVETTNPEQPVVVYYLIPLATLVVMTTVLNLLSIVLFKNRPLQMRVCGINVGIQLGLALIILYLQKTIASDIEVEWTFCYAMLLPVIAAVLDYFAYRFISDDEALIQSLNRLR
ncbi:MAG: DUF4293 domain-containing protein [Bacteroidales bacterium]|nr:DUF4293 domain-containing protein [Bacteroidales bacterium]